MAGILTADALCHLLWATGWNWPAHDRFALSVAVLGIGGSFIPAVLLPLATLLLLGATAAVVAGGQARRRGMIPAARVVVGLVTIGVTLRALLGFLWMLNLGYLPADFYWINALAYVPICVVLAVCGWILIGRDAASRPWRWLVLARSAVGVVPTVLVLALLAAAYLYQPAVRYDGSAELAALGIAGHYVDTPIARFHYIEAGNGSPVVMLSPGSSPVDAWLPEFRALASRHSVYVIDLPGDGLTVAHAGFAYDLPAMSSAIDSVLTALRLRSVVLAGASWSGGWALRFAQLHPERVTQLILLAPSGIAQPDPLSWELFKLPMVGRALANFAVSNRQRVQSALQALFVHRDRVTPELVDAYWASNSFPENIRATYELEAKLDWHITDAALGQTTPPTLVVWGRQDNTLPVSEAAEFRRRLPHGTVDVIDGCGHALTLDCPDQVIALMTGFIRGG